MSLSDLIQAAEQRRSAFDAEVQQLREERRRYASEAKRLEDARERNATDLAGYLMPDLDDEDLLALEKRIAYPVLLGEKRATEAELADVERRRLEVEADPLYAQREVVRIELEQQEAEIDEAVRAFKIERRIWESSDHFLALRGRGWFEPGYDGGLFDWLRDWRACSLLMAHLEEKMPGQKFPDDDDVKEAWRKHLTDSEPVLAMNLDIEAKRARIGALEKLRAELAAKPTELYQALYRKLGGLVVDHLRDSSEELKARLAQGDEVLANFLKKDEGLKKQSAYLKELAVVRLDSQLQQLEAESRKLGQKIDKLRYKRARGKFVWNADRDAAALRDIPYDKWRARRAGHAKTRERIVGFDHYDQGALVRDFLWWDLMTHGARGHDLYEVRTFHQHHPNWSVQSFHDAEAANQALIEQANDLAAAATVDSMMASDDSSISVDAS